MIAPPIFCQQCADELHALAATNASLDAGFCPHNNVLATVTVRAGKITRWRLSTCPSEHHAEHAVAAMRAARGLMASQFEADAAIERAARHLPAE